MKLSEEQINDILYINPDYIEQLDPYIDGIKFALGAVGVDSEQLKDISESLDKGKANLKLLLIPEYADIKKDILGK